MACFSTAKLRGCGKLFGRVLFLHNATRGLVHARKPSPNADASHARAAQATKPAHAGAHAGEACGWERPARASRHDRREPPRQPRPVADLHSAHHGSVDSARAKPHVDPGPCGVESSASSHGTPSTGGGVSRRCRGPREAARTATRPESGHDFTLIPSWAIRALRAVSSLRKLAKVCRGAALPARLPSITAPSRNAPDRTCGIAVTSAGSS
jgi:hypothetical protein